MPPCPFADPSVGPRPGAGRSWARRAPGAGTRGWIRRGRSGRSGLAAGGDSRPAGPVRRSRCSLAIGGCGRTRRASARRRRGDSRRGPAMSRGRRGWRDQAGWPSRSAQPLSRASSSRTGTRSRRPSADSGASGAYSVTRASRVTTPPIDSSRRRITPSARSTAIRIRKSGRSAAISIVRGWSHSTTTASRPPTSPSPTTCAARRSRARSGSSRAGWMKVSGSVSIGSAVQRVVDARRARELAAVADADADEPAPDRPLRAEPVDAAVGPDDLAVGDPDVVAAARLVAGGARRDLRLARVAEDDLETTTCSPSAVKVVSSIRIRSVSNRSSASRMNVNSSSRVGSVVGQARPAPAAAGRPDGHGTGRRRRSSAGRGHDRDCSGAGSADGPR